MKQEFKIGQRVKIHSGANVTDSNNRIGIITHIDKETTIQPHITVEFENGDKNQNGETIAICYPMSYRKFNVEILSEPNTKTQNMTQTISRKGLKEIYDVACSTWQAKIKAMAPKDPFADTVELSQVQVDEMFKASSEPQKEVLRKYFKEDVIFRASQLSDNEMIDVGGFAYLRYNDKLIYIGNSSTGHGDIHTGTICAQRLESTEGKRIPKGTKFTITAA